MLIYFNKDNGRITNIQFGRNTPLLYDETIDFVETIDNVNLARGDIISINSDNRTISINNSEVIRIIPKSPFTIINIRNCDDPILLEPLN